MASKPRGNLGSSATLLNRHSAGFTLMELLVSVTLMGLLAVAIHAGYRIGLNSWAKAEKGMERNRRVQFVLDLISRQVGSIVPYYSRQQLESSPVDVLLFQGTAQGIRFVSTFSAELRAAGGLRLVEYFLVSSGEGASKALVMNEKPLPTDPELMQTVFMGFFRSGGEGVGADFAPFTRSRDSVVLVEELREVRIRYPRRSIEEDASMSSSGTETARMPGRLGMLMMASKQTSSAASNRKERLPLGVELQLAWLDSGFFQTDNFAINIPVQAGF